MCALFQDGIQVPTSPAKSGQEEKDEVRRSSI